MKYFCILFVFVLNQVAYGFSPIVLRNNKESVSRMISDQDVYKMENWLRGLPIPEEELRKKSLSYVYRTFIDFAKNKNHCDLLIPIYIINEMQASKIIQNKKEIIHFYVFLRKENIIDDLLFDLLKKSSNILISFDQNKNRPAGNRPMNVNSRYSKVENLNEFYKPFSTWPDEINACTIQTYFGHINQLKITNNASRAKDLKKLNWLAYDQKVINLETYNRLETLRLTNLTSWPITMTRYMDIIKNAKDKMAKIVEETSTDDFNSTYVYRKQNLTRRGKLYAAYNSTQIFLMSQIIEKTAKRMDARRVELSFQYTDDPKGEGEIYIFSPMEQYRISINMLKKDIAELVRSESFKGAPLEYQDLIASAYETGLIRSNEIDHILKFEEFWNPKTPRWKAYADYAYSLTGTAVYYLPPPWNILGAIGLIMTQIKFAEKEEADASNNWNTII